MIMKHEPSTSDAIIALGFDGGFKLKENKIVVWYREDTQPTEKAIEDKLVELQAEYDTQEYARNRENEYPNLDELLVALYDTDDKAALETKRAAVKTKWPKDNSGPV